MCIICSRNNRSRREFLLIVSQCAADTIYAVAFIFIAAHRLHLAASESPMSVNFLISSIFPLWYMSSRSAYTASLIAVPYGLSSAVLVTNYALLWSDKIRVSALCLVAAGAVHPVSYGIMITIRLLSNSGSAVVYFSIIAYMTSIHNRTLLTISPSQKRLHRTAKFTLGMVMLNSISLLFIPDVLLLINPFNIAQKYAPFLYSLTLTKVGVLQQNFYVVI
ncbi:unnamed protein product [Nippostrongylus brasiliensis]|uniref:G protein-coupled receptor n=1 Tax=Nippostrongylus brasiliensis TaxID=27835 RepID=A0A158R1A7_NIPBR|nr:unnamed protein product [Nippostrongylus brasiliensis]